MSYRSGGYKSPFVGVGAIIGFLVVAAFALRGLSIFGNIAGFGVPTTQTVENQLFANAETGVMYRTLKRTYPQDYAALTADILVHLKAGERTAQIDDLITTDLMLAEKRDRKDVIQAPADLFSAYRRAEIKVVEMLRDADPQFCATYVMTGEVRSTSLRAFQKPLIAYRVAALEAGAEGRDHPAKRTVAAPTAAQVRDIGRRMVASGISETNVSAFLNGTAMAQLPAMDQCRAGLSFYQVLDQMPGDEGNQFYAFLLSRNL
jgi:hypothetical protein